MWPPPCTIRHSKKAKRISLKICQKKGLEVIIPEKRKYYNLNEILEDHKSWINKHLDVILKSDKKVELPTKLQLNSVDKVWDVEYILEHKANNKVFLLENENKLHIRYFNCSENNISNLQLEATVKSNLDKSSGSIITNSKYYQPETKPIKKVIEDWLKFKAKKYLIPWLINLSNKHQLPFNEVKIRKQKTMWGTCDKNKNIGLNCKLLFLPFNLVEHVLLHELCHTKHFNHSKSFWAMLKDLDIEYEKNKAELKKADQYVPYLINV